ncbi:MAG: VOC family protein [Alphaproteobacteria bacterium]|nr:VOC family protein [Alphaproteobacteria bacterium]
MLGGKAKISDVCMICKDLDRSIAFYRDKLGFQLRREADGFADFKSESVVLALWEGRHIGEHVGIAESLVDPSVHKVMTAIEVPDAAEVDTLHASLGANGVVMHGPPKAYPWNAYAFYFADPDGNLWEVYAWVGDPDGYHETFDDD